MIYLVAAIRYRSMIPALYLLGVVACLGRAFLTDLKPIETVGIAPDVAANLSVILFTSAMLVASLICRTGGTE